VAKIAQKVGEEGTEVVVAVPAQDDLRRLAHDSKSIELNFNKYLNGYSKNGGAPGKKAQIGNKFEDSLCGGRSVRPIL
jgi:hypothetical protein